MAVRVKKKTPKKTKKPTTAAAKKEAAKKAKAKAAKKAYNRSTKRLLKKKIVDIYVREVNGTRQIRVPWLPATIKYESGEMIFAEYDILSRGDVAIPTGSGLAKISWESQLPGKKRTDKSLLRGTWREPSYYHNILEKWVANKTSLNVIVTGYPINKDVYLSRYEATPAGGFGDMEYSVEFIEQRDITVEAKKIANKDKTKTKRPSKTTTTYTIKRGDTLWGIATKFLKSGSKWKQIYNLNKTVIEQTAKKRGYKSSNNGWWIFPGTKIQIPKS